MRGAPSPQVGVVKVESIPYSPCPQPREMFPSAAHVPLQAPEQCRPCDATASAAASFQQHTIRNISSVAAVDHSVPRRFSTVPSLVSPYQQFPRAAAISTHAVGTPVANRPPQFQLFHGSPMPSLPQEERVHKVSSRVDHAVPVVLPMPMLSIPPPVSAPRVCLPVPWNETSVAQPKSHLPSQPVDPCAKEPPSSAADGSSEFGSHRSFCTSIPSRVSTDTQTHAPEPVAPAAPKLKLNTVDDLRSVIKYQRLHAEAHERQFPCGPIPGSVDHLEEAVRGWSRVPRTNVSGHGIRRAGYGTDSKTNRRGRRFRFQCSKEPCRTVDCGWTCTYEETTTGWVLVNAKWDHTGHTLVTTAAAAMAARGTSFLPQSLMDYGAKLARQGMGVSEVHRFLQAEANELNIPITWEPSLVRSSFDFIQSTDLHLDQFVEFLLQRNREQNIGSEMRTDTSGTCTHIFVQLEEGMQDWANCEHNVLLFDPTWGTHRSGMKLCCFTTMASSGATVILGFALLPDEGHDSVLWAFRSFHKNFKRAPAAFFTDDAPALHLAFSSMVSCGSWSGAKHFLCTYHLAKNFYKHIHPLVRDVDKWRVVNSTFWKFAKYSDSRFKDYSEWNSFCELIEEGSAPGESTSKTNAFSWLQNLWDRREQWMAKSTWRTTTYGIHSTQRAESTHSAIKSRRLKNLPRCPPSIL